MDIPKKILVRRDFSPQTMADFLPSFDGDPASMVRILSAESVEFYDVERGGEVIARFCVAVGRVELDVLAARAFVPGECVSLDVMPMVESMARERGCSAVTFETFRPGMLRNMSRAGWRGVAVRMWKEV